LQSILERIFSQFMQMLISSSTIRIRGASGGIGDVLSERQPNGEYAPLLQLAADGYHPAVLGNDAAGNRQA
jgi:hypothetical protein